MKKRLIAVFMLVVLALSLVACSGGGSQPTTDSGSQDSQQQQGPSQDLDSVSILSSVWDTYGENDKFYAMGGDMQNPVDNAPGLYSLEDKEALAAMLLVSADASAMIDEAASLIHGMNTNNFTGAAFHLTDAANASAFAEAMKTTIASNQWMCGSPDQYVIYCVNEEYIVMAFGNIDIMKTFKDKFMTVHGAYTQVLVEENVAQ